MLTGERNLASPRASAKSWYLWDICDIAKLSPSIGEIHEARPVRRSPPRPGWTGAWKLGQGEVISAVTLLVLKGLQSCWSVEASCASSSWPSLKLSLAWKWDSAPWLKMFYNISLLRLPYSFGHHKNNTWDHHAINHPSWVRSESSARQGWACFANEILG